MATPAAKFPNAIATDSWLTIATNQLQTQLAVPCGAADTTIGVLDASRIVQWSLLTFADPVNGSGAPATVSEIVLVTAPPAGNILTVQRGYNGSVAKAHAARAIVSGYVVAWHQQALSAEVQAIEQTLGPNLSNVGTGIPGVFVAAKYVFTPQSPGGNLVAGNNVINLNPVPPGISGTDTDHWLYIDQGTGAPEAVLITGGSAQSGGPPGTLIINCAHAHSGAWRIGTATAGISEAIWALPSSGGEIALGGGTLTVHAPIRRRVNMAIWITGIGVDATTIAVAADFPLTARGVFDWTPGNTVSRAAPFNPGGVTNLSIQFIQPDSSNIADYTHWPPAFYASGGISNPAMFNVAIYAAWKGVILNDAIAGGVGGATFSNVRGCAFHTLFTIDRCFDTVRILDMQNWPIGLTDNQFALYISPTSPVHCFDIGRVDDLKIIDAMTYPAFGSIHLGSDGNPGQVIISNIWCDQGGYFQSAGLVWINGGYFSGNRTAEQSIVVTGGQLTIDGARITNSVGYSAIYAVMDNPNAGIDSVYPPALIVSNTFIHTLSGDTLSPVLLTTSGGMTGVFQATFTGNQFRRTPGINYAQPTIEALAGTGETRLNATGNVFSEKGAGNGFSIYLEVDSKHQIVANDGGGYKAGIAGLVNTVWFANGNFSGEVNTLPTPARIGNKLSPATFVPLHTENYIAAETGANNAIAGTLIDAAGVPVPYAAGLKVCVLVAHSLQAGANTMNLNGLGAVAIKSGRNPANNITAAYTAGGIVTLIFDGAQFLDVAQ